MCACSAFNVGAEEMKYLFIVWCGPSTCTDSGDFDKKEHRDTVYFVSRNSSKLNKKGGSSKVGKWLRRFYAMLEQNVYLSWIHTHTNTHQCWESLELIDAPALSTCGITVGICGQVVGVDRWLERCLLLHLSCQIHPPLNLKSVSLFPSHNRIGHRGSYEMIGSITEWFD